MRLKSLPLLPLLLSTTIDAKNVYTDTSRFSQPLFDWRNVQRDSVGLVKRQGSCPAGFNSCALLGAAEACCQRDTVCSRDDANNMACCPSGAACTGHLSGPSQTSASSNFMFPQPGTATTTPPTGPTSPAAPTVPNAPFPFTIIPTTFPNQEACVSAYSGCQAQFSSCTASLGGVNGVTVGGSRGITVPGVQPTVGNPQSVCSSLSTAACHGLQVGYCTAFRDGIGSGGVVAARGKGLVYDIVAGVVVAVAGMVV
ncbi:hypothetical protein I7I50_07170 [Histoplasma capsulatum G186AR]|uniref:Uncharacterized protein n=1 Tax=Ajellomyces capsulatus TaxID=5037 RepID=A0A8H7Z1J4_AJECA|nr:hypothetical protein I7I52_09759 [Histoplasma capsulatum]QSS67937.1 hypothetical protein I7I50_07170 [Histoplasma capsulatum G186AR]